MNNKTKTKEQLIAEIEALRQQIRDLKNVEGEIISLKKDWENIFQSIGHPTVILDAQHNILLVNKATMKAAGASSAEELTGRKCYEIFHNACEPPKDCPLVKMLASEKLELSEMEVEAFNGIYLVSCTPVFDEKGNLEKIIHIATDITERKRAEEALRESEERFRTAGKVAYDLIYEWDLNDDTLEWFGDIDGLLGYRKGEISRNINAWLGLIHAEDMGKLENAVEIHRTSTAPIHYDYRVRHKDGIYRYWIDRALPLLDDKSRPYKWIGVCTDITERKQAELALERSEERYRSLVETQTELVCRFTPDGTFIFVNDIYCNLFGKTKAELIGKKWFPLPVDEDLTLIQQKLQTLSPTNSVVIIENRVVYSKGGIHWIQFVNKGIFNEHGELLEIQSVGRDITELKLVEEALRESEEKYRTLVENIPQKIFTKDRQLVYGSCNKLFARDRGILPEELTGKTDYDFFPKELADKYRADDKRIMESGDTEGIEEEYIQDGEKIWVYTIKTPIRDKEGNITGILGVFSDITYRKRAEEQINRLSAFVEQSTEGMAIADLNGNLIFVNDAWCRMHGYETPGELLGKNLAISHNQEQLEKDVIPFNEKVIKLGSYYGEVGHITKDKKPFPTLMTSTLLKDKQGKPYAIAGVAKDITERKRAEEEMQKLALIVTHSRELVNLAALDGRMIFLNEAGRKMLGIDPEEVEQISIMQVIPDHLLDLVRNQLLPELMEGRQWEGDLQYLNLKTRQLTDVHAITFTIKDPDTGKPIYFANVSLDITKQKRAENEIQDNLFAQSAVNIILGESLEDKPLEEILQKALNIILSVPWISTEFIGSIHLVEDEPEILVLKASCNLPEHVKESCAYVPFEKCLCGKAALTLKTEFARHIDELQYIYYKDIKPHDHYIVPILFSGRTLGVIDIYLDEGHIREKKEEEFLIAVADTLAGIIARRQAEEDKEKLHAQLLQAQKMEAIGQLAGGIAHDFNNILTAMIGYGYLLKTKMRAYDPLKVYAEHILSLSDKAANLTQSLLAFSRKQVINPRPVDINEIIRRIDHLLSRIISEDIQLKTSLSDKDLIVMADPVQIEQILMNLATNARDAMPEGGLLSIRTEKVDIDDEFVKEHGFGEKGKFAVITFADTGAGMDRETLEKIFEPFFTTKEVGKGTGLGLAMVYGIIKQHEGYINVYSEPEKGTTFRIYLPLIEEIAEQIRPEAVQAIEKGTGTVLLAEDKAEVREITRELLEDNGYQVIAAIDGQTALDKFKAYKDNIQLVILDVIMPVKSGKEVYDEIMKIKPKTKVLFMSGYPADVIHKQGIIEKGLAYIEKPASPTKLLKKIREVLTD